jgi:hypothetical protein
VNLLLRVSVEVGVVVALADWGVHTGEGTAAKIVLGVAAPLVGFGFWGAVDFHRFRLAEPLCLIQELAISGLAAVAWYAAARHILGILLGALSIADHALVYASGQRLLKIANSRRADQGCWRPTRRVSRGCADHTTSCEETSALMGGYGRREPVRTPLLADRGGRAGADRDRLGALRALGAPHQASVGWIALIVGLHFIAFRVAGVWGYIVVRAAAALVAFGLAGLGLAAASEAGWTSFVSGVLSGFVLLSGSLYALGTGLPDNRAGANPTSAAPARPTASAGGWLAGTALGPAAHSRSGSSDHRLG